MEKGKIAGKTPQILGLEEGKAYAWCACGLSNNQPYCDGSHKGTNFKPHVFKAENSKKVAFCMCKQTDNHPYCDGNHGKLD